MSALTYFSGRNAFNFFDDFFSPTTSPTLMKIFSDLEKPSRYNAAFSTGDFPPTNILINKETKQCCIEVALAGCTEDEISLTFSNNQLKLKVAQNTKAQDGNNVWDEVVFLQRGLRKDYTVETAWTISEQYYDADSMKVTFKNGLLSIVIDPKQKVDKVTRNLFGKLEDKEVKKLS